MAAKTCPCALAWPLDYSLYDPEQVRMGLEIIARMGEWTTITLRDGKTYRVSRHCIMLHGIASNRMDVYRFEEVIYREGQRS